MFYLYNVFIDRRLPNSEPGGAADDQQRAGAAGRDSRVEQYQSQATTQI